MNYDDPTGDEELLGGGSHNGDSLLHGGVPLQGSTTSAGRRGRAHRGLHAFLLVSALALGIVGAHLYFSGGNLPFMKTSTAAPSAGRSAHDGGGATAASGDTNGGGGASASPGAQARKDGTNRGAGGRDRAGGGASKDANPKAADGRADAGAGAGGASSDARGASKAGGGEGNDDGSGVEGSGASGSSTGGPTGDSAGSSSPARGDEANAKANAKADAEAGSGGIAAWRRLYYSLIGVSGGDKQDEADTSRGDSSGSDGSSSSGGGGAEPSASAPSSPSGQGDKDTTPPDNGLYLTVPKLGIHGHTVREGNTTSVLDQGAMKLPETGFPWEGEGTNTYIACHRLGWPGTESYHECLNLPSMEKGDAISLTDSNGKEYDYRVTETYDLKPEDSWITRPVAGKEVISLQTCVETLGDYYTLGPTWSARFVVRAERV